MKNPLVEGVQEVPFNKGDLGDLPYETQPHLILQ